ncbi:MAG: DUF3793 family protein [Lachnospiraceae bacterium]|nr:DUF3793 family protein [Lachnospiraceae bacterium]
MGTEAINYVLGQQCAPVIAGVKPSNLLIVEKGNQSRLRHVLKGTDLHSYLLYTSEQKDYWLLFETERLWKTLMADRNRLYLRECGYDMQDSSSMQACLVMDVPTEIPSREVRRQDGSSMEVRCAKNEFSEMDVVFVKLAARFRSYKEGKSDFPHEMGIFLGYPLEDVRGFIENRGQNFKMSGYWKVYGDVAYASRVFQLYERAKALALDLCGQGMGILDIWRSLRNESALSAVSA